MKKIFSLLILLLTVYMSFAQFPIGHQSHTYNDPARSRDVANEIYYPAVSAGNNTNVAVGQFPIIVFGHGFMMAYDAYAYLKDAIVPLGYIVAFPTTEGGTSPVHADFGADLAFIINKLKTEGSNSASPFYNHISSTSAVMGHSMGGGASFLACENNVVPTCMITFAAANTTPSSITAAYNVTIPALVISGSVDCVAPATTNQTPMYDSLASTCKVFLSINQGCHCYFGDYNFYCTLGESTCLPVPPLDRASQEDVTLNFLKLYLDYYLNGNASAWTVFNDSLTASSRITYLKSCPSVGTDNISYDNLIHVFPNPAEDYFMVELSLVKDVPVNISLTNMLGENVFSFREQSNNSIFRKNISTENLPKGFYLLIVEENQQRYFSKIVKQ
jgi:dienelactone hydrolase